MAQLNITLNQEEILQLLSEDREEAFKVMLQSTFNQIMKVESEEQLCAKRYERSEARTDSRNGERERSLTTRIGKIKLKVPRHRNVPFHTLIFDNYTRSEASLITTMAEMVVAGVSTRKVGQVMETLCGTSFSKSSVSEVCKTLDEEVERFRSRELTEEYPFLIIDATYFKVREEHRITAKAFMIAIGITDEGHRQIIGFAPYENESAETWSAFLESLKARGLHGVRMVTSDAHEGILSALGSKLPTVPWQRCHYHFTKNIVEKSPKKYQEGLRTELREMFNCETIDEARARMDEIIRDYADVAEDSMNCLDEGFEDSMTVMALPEDIRTMLRTSNMIERVNKELKRRSKVIGIFPNAASITRLMGSVLIDVNEGWMTGYRLFYRPTYNAVVRCTVALQEIARIQQNVRRSS